MWCCLMVAAAAAGAAAGLLLLLLPRHGRQWHCVSNKLFMSVAGM